MFFGIIIHKKLCFYVKFPVLRGLAGRKTDAFCRNRISMGMRRDRPQILVVQALKRRLYILIPRLKDFTILIVFAGRVPHPAPLQFCATLRRSSTGRRTGATQAFALLYYDICAHLPVLFHAAVENQTGSCAKASSSPVVLIGLVCGASSVCKEFSLLNAFDASKSNAVFDLPASDALHTFPSGAIIG